MRDLVWVRHKNCVYVSRAHPHYKDTSQVPETLIKVDEIKTVPTPSGATIWLSIIAYCPKNKILDLRVRVEECDQFIYLEEDK